MPSRSQPLELELAADQLPACPPLPTEGDDGPWQVLPVPATVTRQTPDDACWRQLLADIAWPAPAPDPDEDADAVVVRVRCGTGATGSWHVVAVLPDGRTLQQVDAAVTDEHIASALAGQPTGCIRLAEAACEMHRVRARLHRLEPPGDWHLEVEGDGPELPTPGPPIAALDRHLGLTADGVALARLVGFSAEPPARPAWVAGRHNVYLRRLWEAPPPPASASRASGRVLEGAAGVELLWRHGLHPDLVAAMHRALGGGAPLPAIAYAALVLPRSVPDEPGLLPPMPVPWVRLLADTSDLGDRTAAVTLLAVHGLPSDEAEPRSLLGWLRSPLLTARDGWPRLHRRGITPAEVLDWALLLRGRTLPEYVRWLWTYPIAVAGDPWPGDVVDTLLDEAIQAVRNLVSADEYHSSWEDDTSLLGDETLQCLNHAPVLLDAVDSGDPTAMRAAATTALGMHTYHLAYKNYRYHVDICSVSDLARIVLAMLAWPHDPGGAYGVLIGGEDEDDDFWPRHRNAACHGMWLALTYRDGLLMPAEGLDSRWWQDDGEDADPRTTYPQIVRAVVQAGLKRNASMAEPRG